MKNKHLNEISIKPKLSATLFTTCIFVTLLFSCVNSKNSPTQDKIADNLTIKVGKLLQRKYGTKLIGTGGAVDKEEYKHKVMMIGLQIDHLVDKDEARMLAVNVATQFLKHINESEKIRPYLSEYPFAVKNIRVKLFVQPRNNIKAVYPYPSVITICQEDVIYYYYETGHEDRYASTEKETYEEALAIIAKDEEQTS